MIVDAGQDVGEIGLRIETIPLGGLDAGHGAGQRFAAAVGPGEEPVLATCRDRTQGALDVVRVDGHLGVVEKTHSPARRPQM